MSTVPLDSIVNNFLKGYCHHEWVHHFNREGSLRASPPSYDLTPLWKNKNTALLSHAIQRDHNARNEGVKTYLAYNPSSNLYKIGMSENPSKSVSLLRYIEGSNLEMLYVVNEDLESDLYKRFATHCHAGEWFTDEGGSMQDYFKAKSEQGDI